MVSRVSKFAAALFLALLFLFAAGSPTLASESLGTIDSTDKYAWGENIGWINFGCDECDVTITDNSISGYAWNSQWGWINLNPSYSGVTNDKEGTLGGFAWSSNLGWINFTGVTINASGEFMGYATVAADDSRISFNCANGGTCASADFKVSTDWRPPHLRSSGGASGSAGKPKTPPPVAPPVVPPPATPTAPVPPAGLTANVYDTLDYLSEFLARLFRRSEPEPALVEVPKIAPVALGSLWNLLPVKAINSFVFAPLPYEIRVLAGKFPELERTFQEVGIERFSDAGKLAGVDLKIPGLTDVLNTTVKNLNPEELAELENISGVKLTIPGLGRISDLPPGAVGRGAGKIALIEGLPLAKFSVAAKKDLPSEFVFARAAGELVDLGVALSVEESGQVAQRLSALPGKTLKLVVKPISRARSVSGYIVFVAPTPRITKNEILRSSLTASALFSMSGLVENIPPAVGGAPPEAVAAEKKLVLSSFEYEDPDKDGIYTADVTMPVVSGEYEVITVIDYIDPELGARKMSMITVIDPEGYVYEKNNGKETRIPNAIISLYRLNIGTKQYELWNATDYQQENPQITDVRGTYSFLVPSGTYYFHVEAPGYQTYEGKAFVVAEGNSIHQNIELGGANKWAIAPDWQTVLLIVVLLLLVYNSVRSRARGKAASPQDRGTATSNGI